MSEFQEKVDAIIETIEEQGNSGKPRMTKEEYLEFLDAIVEQIYDLKAAS